MSILTQSSPASKLESDLLVAVEKTADSELMELAGRTIKISNEAPKCAEKHLRPMIFLRLLIVLTLLFLVAGGWFIASMIHLQSGINTWSDVIGVAGKASQCLLLLPVVLSILFIERLIKRRRMLEDLRGLQKLNAQIYEAQFNHNPFGEVNPHKLTNYLDCCCGLLFLIRKAATCYDGTTDEVVLGQVAAIQSGSSDNHRNILMKMGMISKEGSKS